MANKPFNKTHHQYGIIGEDFVQAWLSKLGYTCYKPTDKYGPDLMLEVRGKMYPCEVERRRAVCWHKGMFPFDTYNLPERRYKKLRKGPLFVLPHDMDRCLIVYPSSLSDALKFNRFVEKDSRHAKGEKILEIDVDLCRDVCTNDNGLRIGRNEEF